MFSDIPTTLQWVTADRIRNLDPGSNKNPKLPVQQLFFLECSGATHTIFDDHYSWNKPVIILFMEKSTAEKLISINLQFYQTFSNQFSATRQRIQPGVRKILAELNPDDNILDIGCGNGNVWQVLADGNHRGAYVGLDFSSEILKIAALEANERLTQLPGLIFPIFLLVDLIENDWASSIPSSPFNSVFLFAVLHHLPSVQVRSNVLQQIRRLLTPESRLCISVWQFLNSARLRARIQDWSKLCINPHDIDPGDFLIDWRSGGTGFRYVHHFGEEELHILASQNGFKVVNTFSSDGADKVLGLYQVWELLK